MMDKKDTDAEIKMRYQYSVRVLKTCVDVPDKVKEAAEILKELAEGGHVEAQAEKGGIKEAKALMNGYMKKTMILCMTFFCAAALPA